MRMEQNSIYYAFIEFQARKSVFMALESDQEKVKGRKIYVKPKNAPYTAGVMDLSAQDYELN